MRLAVGLLLLIASTATAEPRRKREPMKRVYVRGVVTHVEPRITTRGIQLDPSPIVSTAVAPGVIDDSGVTVNGATGPTAIIGYVPDGLGRFSIETVVGIPTPLKIEATGRLATESLAPDAAGYATGIPPLGRDLAQAVIAAPMVTAMYRMQTDRVTVFAGLGASVLFVYGEKITNPVLTEVAVPQLTISHAAGVVVQGGLEGRLWKHVKVRLDAKYIAYRESHATIDDIQVKTQIPLLPTVDVGSASMAVATRPIMITAGVGADF